MITLIAFQFNSRLLLRFLANLIQPAWRRRLLSYKFSFHEIRPSMAGQRGSVFSRVVPASALVMTYIMVAAAAVNLAIGKSISPKSARSFGLQASGSEAIVKSIVRN